MKRPEPDRAWLIYREHRRNAGRLRYWAISIGLAALAIVLLILRG